MIKGQRVTREFLCNVPLSIVVAGLGIGSLIHSSMILMQMANTIADCFSASTVNSLLNREASF